MEGAVGAGVTAREHLSDVDKVLDYTIDRAEWAISGSHNHGDLELVNSHPFLEDGLRTVTTTLYERRNANMKVCCETRCGVGVNLRKGILINTCRWYFIDFRCLIKILSFKYPGFFCKRKCDILSFRNAVSIY